MIRFVISASFILTSYLVKCQESPMAPFENLMNKTWLAEGKWGDGSLFKQETTFEYGLNKQIIIARSKGFTNQEQTEFGDRNHGIRKYDDESGKILFWEFDVFGGTTTGEVAIEGNKMLYLYEYGGSMLADVWEPTSATSYSLKVMSYEEGKMGQVFMEGVVRMKE